MLDPVHGIALITDGSSSHKDKTGGYAWIALDATDGVQKGSGYRSGVTNNQMELLAPTEGLLWLREEHGPCEVLIFSDSQYVVLGANNPSRKRYANRDWFAALDAAMAAHAHVEFTHVRGHRGHYWNEIADQLAGEARLKGAA